MKKLLSFQLFMTVGLVFLVSCNHFVDTKDNAPTLANTDAVLKISYELETITVTKKMGDNAKPDPLYEIRARPLVNRAFIDLKISDDGNSEWEIKNLEPTFSIPSPQANIPPDNSAKTALTRIKNGMAYFYGKDQKLLRTHQMQMPNFQDLLNGIKGTLNPASVVSARIANGGEEIDVKEKIEQATRKGHQITELGKGLLAIRARIDRNGKGTQFNGKEQQFTSVDILDTNAKVILGTSMYDQNENLVSRMIYKHKYEKENVPQVEMSHYELFGKDSKGVSFTTTTTSYYRNMTIENSVVRK
ncbi:MAG: hypothetical protein EAZ32_18200 [Cytophagia bacterium]|nr:MAG: hypothetical protein EAZ46_11940 [Runella sp.]TAG16296.1 MAG: hypothetical protein EAZ38_18885 [Cytophagales bacterium]TAG35569.1 MAG: hypothetical protein EAZ32_18200 [Cytophagia bacterium]TAG77382.1 MAG: hypothetical protein EAZ22_15795 [Cytophagales bacterium]